ncbi:MAG: sugar ABC transporter permease [Clostridia bacterium]|nr:sugar ABC transporter permease [Clostridia bacterium]
MNKIAALFNKGKTRSKSTNGDGFRKKRKRRNSVGACIFIVVMLAYPVLQFLITWLYVNINSVALVFQRQNEFFEYEWVGFDNVIAFFRSFKIDPATRQVYLNSFLYMPVTCMISIPLATVFSYFLYKEMPLSGVFRVIYFIPNIIPVVALTLAFRMPFEPGYGFLNVLMQKMGLHLQYFGKEPNAQIMVYIYCIWAGLGYNIVLLSGAIGRVPEEVLESARLDGVGPMREFFQFVVPLIWPTLTTLIILGMTNVLTLYLQPYLLTKGANGTQTIGMVIFTISQSDRNLESAATTGLLCSLIWAPVILTVRHFMSKCFAGVDY